MLDCNDTLALKSTLGFVALLVGTMGLLIAPTDSFVVAFLAHSRPSGLTS